MNEYELDFQMFYDNDWSVGGVIAAITMVY